MSVSSSTGFAHAPAHPDFDTAITEMTRLGQTFESNPQAQAIYEDIYRNVYGKMYGRLKPLYEALRKVNTRPPAANSQ
jgi:hypothetical protein